MNIQRAIRIIDKTDPDLLTEEYCEALSIILDSAKLLHQELELKVAEGYEESKVVELETNIGFMTNREGLRKLGIEVEQ